MTSAPVPFTVPPINRSPGCLATGMDSPVTMASSTALWPFQHRAVHRDAVAGTHAKPVAGMHGGQGISSSSPWS